ncbi:MAG: FadR family transcriptional regulator [Gluconacetobacter diazotrophicus]|nr:FadR family transcriptional regulator [Gluconacetobacter diazotrophicus]
MRRLHDSIARDIGIRIAAEELRPGDLLLGEIEAADQLAVSRTAYREAVRILAAKGMVESRTKTGTKVSARARWHILDPEVLGWFLETKPSERFVHDLFEVREMVEPHAAELAARNRSEPELAAIGRALDDMDRLGLATEAGRAADRAFHQAILSASGNEMIAALGSSVAAAIVWTTLFKHRAQRHPRNPIVEHRAVFEAIRDGNASRARELMEDLVRFAFADMQASLTEGSARLISPA